ncbi:hypothetical protein LCGC14_0758990 [marine sediment metagenome]|uniref:Bacteriophage T4 Gp32 single-stranded DNA-binding domain-containing protein n=1 Tax=marine sediment metagenome TaxID=412755 RepID=A0A0F9Q1W1_9ZZZZ
MGTKVIGKLDSWGDADLGSNDFMNLEEGTNPVRLITSPYQFYIHWTKDATDANRKVRCALEGCPVCQNGERATARWYVNVINRKTERCAILEIGPQIFKQILGLAKKEKWGDPRRYDLDIERQPKGSQPLYIVQPDGTKEPLADDEKGMVKEFLARIDLAKMVEAPTAAEVREKVGMSPVAEESSVDNSFENVAVETSTDDDDDFDFGE